MLFKCQERRGLFLREVIETHWSRKLQSYLEYRLAGLPEIVQNLTLVQHPDSRIFLVDDVGFLLKGPLWYLDMPDVHCVFWDRVLRGRESMCRDMCKLVSDKGGVWTASPVGSRIALEFARRIGFRATEFRQEVVVLTMLFT